MVNGKSKKTESHKTQTPILEWLLGGLGVALLVSCVTFLIYEGMNDDERPGEISANVKEIISARNAHIVTFELHNSGTQTLSNVHVSARIIHDGREVERVQTVIDSLPGRSHQEGGFYFTNDPRAFKLEITPEGYQKP